MIWSYLCIYVFILTGSQEKYRCGRGTGWRENNLEDVAIDQRRHDLGQMDLINIQQNLVID